MALSYDEFRRKAAENQKALETNQARARAGTYRVSPAIEAPASTGGKYDFIRDALMNTQPVETETREMFGPPVPEEIRNREIAKALAPEAFDPFKALDSFNKKIGFTPAMPNTKDAGIVSDITPITSPESIVRLKPTDPAKNAAGKQAIQNITGANDKLFKPVTIAGNPFGVEGVNKTESQTVRHIPSEKEYDYSLKGIVEEARDISNDRRADFGDSKLGKIGYKVVDTLFTPLDVLQIATEPFSNVAGQYYTPGGGLAAAAGMVKGTGALISKVSPTLGLSEKLAPTIGREVIKEGVTGGILGAGQSLASNPGGSLEDFAKTTAMGIGFGAAGGTLGPLIGAGVKAAQGASGKVLGNQLNNLDVVDQVVGTGRKEDYVVGQLDDVNEQIKNLTSRTNKGGTYADELATLSNEQNALRSYATEQQLDIPANRFASIEPEPVKPAGSTELPAAAPASLIDTVLNSSPIRTAPEASASGPARLVSAAPVNNLAEIESRLMQQRAFSKAEIEETAEAIKQLQNTAGKAPAKAAADLNRAVDLADALTTQLTKAGNGIEATNVWNLMTPDSFVISLNRNLSRINQSKFGLDVSKYKTLTPVDQTRALNVAAVAQRMGEHMDDARNAYTILANKRTAPLTASEQDVVNTFLKRMQTSLDSGALKNLKQPEVVKYRTLIDEMANGATQTDRDFLMSTIPNVIRMSSRERKVALQDMQMIKNGQDELEFRLGRKLATMQYVGMLYNVPTQLRNIISNTLMYSADRLSHVIAVPFDMTRSVFTGRKREIFLRTGGEMGESFFGGLARDVSNFKEGGALGARAGWNGINPEGLTSKYEIGGFAFTGQGKFNIMGKTMRFLERTLGAAMKGADHASYNVAYQRRLVEASFAQAKEAEKLMLKNGVKPKADFVKLQTEMNMQKANGHFDHVAKEYGLYMTLQDDTAFSRLITKGRRKLNKLTGSEEFGIGNIAMPFAKVPANIAMRVIDYSPIGVAKSVFKLHKAKSDYEIALRNRSLNDIESNAAREGFAKDALSSADWALGMSVGRAVMGTSLGAATWWLADKGLIWGSSSKDMNERKFDQSQGKEAFQMNISGIFRAIDSIFNDDNIDGISEPQDGDLFVSYEYFQPVAFPVAIASNIYKTTHAADAGKNLPADILDNIGQTVDFVAQSSPLRGIRDLFNVSAYSDQSMLAQVGENLLSQAAGQLIPSMAKQINNTIDKTTYETYDPDFTQSLLNRLQAAAPLGKDGLPQRVTTLGDPVNRENNDASLFNPFRTNTFKESDASSLISELLGATGDKSVLPRTAAKTITYKVDGDDYKVKLSGQEWTDLQATTGLDLQKRLSLIDPNLPVVRRKVLVEEAMAAAAKRARDMLKYNLQVATKAEKNKAAGIDVSSLMIKK